MKFRSAVDTWFYLVIVATAIIVIAAGWPVFAANNIGAMLTVTITAVIAIGLPLWLLYSTEYKVTFETLTVRSGPFIWRIPRSQIREVIPTRSMLSSPALSLDRLEIRYGSGKSILVSPVDKKGFIDALGLDAGSGRPPDSPPR